MNFAHPSLLAVGLGCVALPVLIHILMRRRRRPTRWAAMRFLLEAYKRQRQRVRFEQWLLLAARCLIVALAAIAIARPTLPGGDPLLGSRATTLYLVIDNSLAATHGTPEALAAHKEAASDLLERLDPLRGDRAAVVTLAGPAAGVVSPASSAIQSVGAAVRAVEPADSAADLHGALGRIAADISQDTPAGSRSVVVVLSEFRAGSSPIDRPLPTLGESAEVAIAATTPAASGLDNIAITAVEPLRPIVLGATDVSTTQVRVRAARFGPGVASRVEVEVELLARERDVIARGRLVFEAGSREAVTALGVDGTALGDLRRDGPGPVVLAARLGTPDPLWRDNTRRAVIDRRESLLVGLIAPRRFGPRPSVSEYRAADWVSTALDPEGLREGGQIRVQAIDPATVDASTLAGLEAVVVAEPQGVTVEGWSALRRFADLGGLVLLFPQPGDGAQLWTDAAIGAFGVAWELPREAIELEAAANTIETPVGPSGAAPGAGEEPVAAVAGSSEPIGPSTTIVRPEIPSPLLSMIEGELAELLRPIRAVRAMPAVLRGQSSELLLQLGDGRALAIAAPPGSRDSGTASDPTADTARGQTARGLIVYIGLALDLEWSDLPTKPLLLPLVQEIVRQGASVARGGGVALAGALPVASPGAVELAWNGPGAVAAGAPASVPLQPLGVARQAIRHAGIYRGVDAAGASRGLVLINPDTAGSDTDTRSQRDIASWLETAGAGRPIWLDPSGASPSPGTPPQAALSEQLSPGASDGVESRRDLSWLPLLFGLALALAVVEAVAARIFSHAGTAPAKGGA